LFSFVVGGVLTLKEARVPGDKDDAATTVATPTMRRRRVRKGNPEAGGAASRSTAYVERT
jgi:hypothetical protein